MEYTLEDKYKLIYEDIINNKSKNPLEIVRDIMKRDYMNIHGPEHHFLDGAAFLAAYKNSGGDINVEEALNKLKARSVKMPGAMCGYWGICGSSASLGAALSIIHNTGPLSNDIYYSEHMEYISKVINKMSKIGGPRCCKRNAYLSIINAVVFVKEKYDIKMEIDNKTCEFSNLNKQCIKEKCPFYKG